MIRYPSLVFTAVISLGLISYSAFADIPAFQNLSTANADKVLDNLGSALYFRSVEPVSSNGMVWGFGLGVVGSATTMNQIEEATGQGGALPAGDIVATVQAPLGVALEAGFIPSVEIGSGKIKRSSFNLKWTWTNVFPMPVNSSVRVGFGSTNLNWRDSAANADFGFKSRFTQFQAAISQKFAIIEPYLGLGLISQKSNLSATGTTPLVSGQYSYGRKKSSFWLSGGAELNLLILSLGGQLDRAFGETSLSLRLGFKI